MVEPTGEQLAAELAELKAANAELTRALVQEQARHPATESSSSGKRSKRAWGRILLSMTLIVIGTILAPVAIVSTWAHRELTDTAYFVDTFAPLAEDPAVQDFVASQTVASIESRIDVDKIADDLFAGLDDLDLEPRAKEALGLLQAPAVAGVKSLISSTVTRFVQSDVFAVIWKDALTITHQQLVSTATGKKDAAITIGPNQQISLELGPIIEAVKEQLVAEGFELADRIPATTRSIVIAENSSVGTYLAIYHFVVAVGVWLPWAMLIILAAGVLVARRRAAALAWACGGVLLSMVLVGNGIDIGRNFFALAVSSSIPHDAAIVLYEGILGFVMNMVVVVGVLAATLLVIVLLSGPWQWARALRGFGSSGFAAIRHSAERHGITTGRAGEWLHRWRAPLRVIVGAAGSAFILFHRPITPGMVAWTATATVASAALLELLSRSPGEDETRATTVSSPSVGAAPPS